MPARDRSKKPLIFGKQTLIMGILNLTPDSFSGDGLFNPALNYLDSALKTAEAMLADGADIIDVGGESSRPGSIAISAEEEIDRIATIIEKISEKLDVLISIDTYKAKVAKIATDLGATIINDISALQADPEMANVVIQSGANLILMHNSANPEKIEIDQQIGASYNGLASNDIVTKVKLELKALAESALANGISREKLILDPGFGFGKTQQQNLELLARINEFKSLGYPLLAATSRKSFIGQTLNLAVDQRLEGSLASVALSIDRGVNIVRVHDIKAAKRVAILVDTVKSYEIS